VFGLVLSSCSRTDTASKGRAGEEPSAQVGGSAPDFTLKDVSGKDTPLSSFRGKVVLLEFWATWCPPCKAAVPELKELHGKYHDRGFAVVGVSVDADSGAAAKVAQFSSSYNINYPLLIANDKVTRAYSVMSIPVSFLISKDGTIVESYVGYADNFGQKVSARVEKLL
jgi:peroxiredoxin